MVKVDSDFQKMIDEAMQAPFSGWDFSFIRGRWNEEKPSWNYRDIVVSHMENIQSMLDMDTGGGEFLASLPKLPPHTFATEGYIPNISVAQERLTSLGVEVRSYEVDGDLPFDDEQFDLIINRHGSYSAKEIYRILKSDGKFVTQQVGGKDNIELNEFLQEMVQKEFFEQDVDADWREFQQAGFSLVEKQEEFLDTRFFDIGAVVFYLRIIGWQIPDFSVETYYDKLFAMHQIVQQKGYFETHNHRTLLIVEK